MTGRTISPLASVFVRARTVGLLMALSLGSGGCKEAASPRAPDAADATPAPGAVYRTQPCRDLLTRYREVLAAGSGTCTADADCARYGGVDPDNVCGGTTDAKTADALQDVRAQMDTEGCIALPYSCPAYGGECVAGACQRPQP